MDLYSEKGIKSLNAIRKANRVIKPYIDMNTKSSANAKK